MSEKREEIRPALIPEKQDKPRTKFGQWLKKTFGKKPETPLEQDAADITSESQKKREAVDQEVQLPNKPYDLRAAIKHFESLKPEVKQKISDFFGGEWPNINKQDFVLFDQVYKFQNERGLKQDAIAGPATREVMFGKSSVQEKTLTAPKVNVDGTTLGASEILDSSLSKTSASIKITPDVSSTDSAGAKSIVD